MMYDDNRYEVEAKYTQFITLTSRPVWPRLDMTPLAAVLNQLEARYSSSSQQQQQQHGVWRSSSGSMAPASAAAVGAVGAVQQQQQGGGGSPAAVRGGTPKAAAAAAAVAAGSLRWVANSLTDTGACLRVPGGAGLV